MITRKIRATIEFYATFKRDKKNCYLSFDLRKLEDKLCKTPFTLLSDKEGNWIITDDVKKTMRELSRREKHG